MSDRPRLRREDLPRTGPIRNWSTLYQQTRSPSDSGSTSSHQTGVSSVSETSSPGSINDVVRRGVEIGYRVIEDYLRQGQQTAQQINNQSYSFGKMNSDVRELTERIFRDSTELFSLWVDLMNNAVANTVAMRNGGSLGQTPANISPNGAYVHSPPSSSNSRPVSFGTAVSIEIIATRPTQVTLDLPPASGELSLITHGLRSIDPEKAALTDITFSPGIGGSPTHLRIVVPVGHPADLYTGVVLDKSTGQIRGTLSVRLSE